MGKIYRALHTGTMTELSVRDGDLVEPGNVVAKTMWTDERGRSLTGGWSVSIKSPISGRVRYFVTKGDLFHKDDPLFQIVRPGEPDF